MLPSILQRPPTTQNSSARLQHHSVQYKCSWVPTNSHVADVTSICSKVCPTQCPSDISMCFTAVVNKTNQQGYKSQGYPLLFGHAHCSNFTHPYWDISQFLQTNAWHDYLLPNHHLPTIHNRLSISCNNNATQWLWAIHSVKCQCLFMFWEEPGSNLSPQTGHHNWRFLQSSPVPPSNVPNQATTISFHVVANSLFSHRPVTWYCIALTKQQFVATQRIRRTEIPALLYSWVTNTPSVTMFVSTKKLLLLIFL
jgi:hypothetical protein